MAWVSGDPRAMTHMQSYPGSIGGSRVSSPRRRRRGERDTKPERQADIALSSWRVGQGSMQLSNLQSSLNLSSRVSDTEMKEAIKHRGGHQIAGLHYAATQADPSAIFRIVKAEGPNIQLNQLDANNLTPLMYAVLADSRQALEILVNSGCRKEQVDTEGRSATHYAAFFGRHKALKFLVDTASDWAARDNYGRTPLHWACASRNTHCLLFLLQHAKLVMGDISPRDNEGMTPLHCVAHFCKPRHIAALDEAECDFSAVDIEGRTALHWTVTNPNPSALNALIQAYPPLLNERDVYGSTILHLAAEHGAFGITRAILERKDSQQFDIDAKNNLEQTPLHLASKGGHDGIVKLLLDNNANDSVVDKAMLSPLHYAVESYSLNCIDYFTQRPGVANLSDANGRNPIMLAAMKGQDKILQMLLSNKKLKSDINQGDESNSTALHSACSTGAHACVSVLLDNVAEPNVVDCWQQTALFVAAEGGHTECIIKLIAGGCDADILAADGMATIHRAVLMNQLECISALILSNVNLNVQDTNGDSSIHLAVLKDFLPILTLLLDHLADPNIQNFHGMTALHYAATEGKAEAIAILLDHKAYPNFMDLTAERYTPLDYAILNNHSVCVDILKAASATTHRDIFILAATLIQAAYRGYRARKLRKELYICRIAAQVITAYVKGYIQRKRYREMLARHKASIVLQSYTRGYLQRKLFKVQLHKYREKMRHVKLMEEFSRRIASDKEAQLLKTFTISLTVSKPVQDTAADSVEEDESEETTARQRKKRLEEALKMREIEQKTQEQWVAFREAERQRRINKANKLEADRLAVILAESKARREYHNTKYSQTNTIRSHFTAAVAIQRWYKKTKRRKQLRQQEEAARRAYEAEQRNRAAVIIQKWWKKIILLRQFHTLLYRPITTSPVILPYRQSHSSINQRSYLRKTSVTDIPPQRKLTRTAPSGFFIPKKICAPGMDKQVSCSSRTKMSTSSLLSNMAKKKEVRKKSLSHSTTTSRLPKPLEAENLILPVLRGHSNPETNKNTMFKPTLYLPPIV